VPYEHLLRAGADAGQLLGLDDEITRPSLHAFADGRLTERHPGARQHRPLARRARGQQHRGGRPGLSQADRRHVAGDEAHRVVDRRHGFERSAGGVDAELDVAVRGLVLQVHELGRHVVRRRLVDPRPEEDDALLEQLRVRVRRPVPEACVPGEPGQDMACGRSGHGEPLLVAEPSSAALHCLCQKCTGRTFRGDEVAALPLGRRRGGPPRGKP